MPTPRRRSILPAFVLVLGSAGVLCAASFGVPPGPALMPDGWFMLVGKDAVDEVSSNAFGDISRTLTLHIEVTGRTLQLCIYDPGTFDATLAGGQLDFDLSLTGSAPAPMYFELKDPLGTSLKIDNSTFGPDTLATDNALWCFYDTAAGDPLLSAGTHEFTVRYVDGPGNDEFVNVFGVETTPDYAAYAYHATVGHAPLAGAGLATGLVRMYPYILDASAGSFPGGGGACAYDVVTFDADAPVLNVAPPEMVITTRLGYVPPGVIPVSQNNTVQPYPFYDLVGLNASDDHGLHSLEITRLADDCGGVNCVLEANLVPPLPAPLDFNAFSFQLYNTGEILPSLFYPLPGNDAIYEPRRIYLPARGGGKPAKEWVGHLITNPPAGGLYTQGQATTIDVQVRIENPTVYDLVDVVGQTTVNPLADFGPPTGVTAAGGPGASAVATGKRIDFSFIRVRAGQVGTIDYTVTYLPGAPDFYYVTGDGVDFEGGSGRTTETWVEWDTNPAIHLAEEASPCMIQLLVEPAPCTVNAAAAGPAGRVCRRAEFTLDGSGTTFLSCAAVEYRWSGPGIAAPVFSTDPTIIASSPIAGINTYTLDARCIATPGCTDTTTVDVDVSTGMIPVADTGGDVTVASCGTFPFQIGTPGDTATNSYLWTSPTAPIATLLAAGDEFVPEPTFIETALGSYDLTLTVSSLADGACFAVDTMTVDITDGATTGVLGNGLRAVRDVAGDVELTWPLGVVAPDRYNVHRASCTALTPPPLACMAEIDKSALPGSYVAAILNPAEILLGTYTDASASPDPLYLFEVYGRRCDGTSDIN